MTVSIHLKNLQQRCIRTFSIEKKLDLQGGKTATGHCIKKKIFSRRSRLKKILTPAPPIHSGTIAHVRTTTIEAGP
jgi:hypothetical protein